MTKTLLTFSERTRLLHGWAFRNYTDAQVAAIRVFLDTGEIVANFPCTDTVNAYLAANDRYLR